jgi:hypothetical protein
MSKDIAILGCGPAGLLTAWAVEQAGYCPVIFSRPEKSQMPGAQFLHESIPDVTNDDPEAPTSWDAFHEGPVKAWSLAAAYDRLWDRYRPDLVEGEVTPRLLDGIESRFTRAFSTVPAYLLCANEHHRFPAAQVWIRNWESSAEGWGFGNDFVEYNGHPGTGYYRASKIGDQCSMEFGHRVGRADPGAKPLDTTCNCRPFFQRLGRFGKWRKGVLVHHAYKEAGLALL